MKRLMTAANMTMKMIARTDFSTESMGSFAMRMMRMSTAAVSMKPK